MLLPYVLWGCGSLRSELYREETAHRYKAACKQYKGGDYEAARSGFESVIGLDSEYGPAHAALGNLALIREDYPGALAHYRAALEADPELEADLQPLIMVASAHQVRAPLQKAGVTLNQLYPLIMAARNAEVEALLEKDIPLQLLARDTMGITPGKLGEMQAKIAETADPLKGSPRYRLFLGYVLFFGEIDDAKAAVLVESAVAQVMVKDRGPAFFGNQGGNGLVLPVEVRDLEGWDGCEGLRRIRRLLEFFKFLCVLNGSLYLFRAHFRQDAVQFFPFFRLLP